jgi:hypothetical protein
LDPAHSNTPDPGHRQKLQELPLPIFADPIAIKCSVKMCQVTLQTLVWPLVVREANLAGWTQTPVGTHLLEMLYTLLDS